MTGLDLFPSSH